MSKIISKTKRFFKFIVSIPVRLVKVNYLQLLKSLKSGFVHYTSFGILLSSYMTMKIIEWMAGLRFMPKFFKNRVVPVCDRVFQKIYKFNRYQEATINRVNLIDLALKNMFFKKARSIITVGGMSVGIAAIVFLVSIGYGLQNLVIEKVADLNEIKQIDVSVQVGSNNKINDESIAKIGDLEGVDKLLPLISVVGRVNFQNSVTDAAVFGVTTDYLKETATTLSEGELFDSNDLSNLIIVRSNIAGLSAGEVAGVSDVQETAPPLSEFRFTIEPDTWVRVRKGPSLSSEVIGYTRRVEGTQVGEEVLGDTYQGSINGYFVDEQTNEISGKWIKSKVFLWEQVECDETNVDCEEGKYMKVTNDQGFQVQDEGYFAEIGIVALEQYKSSPEVLGMSATVLQATDSAQLEELAVASDSATATDSGVIQLDDGFVEIASESASLNETPVNKVDLNDQAKKQAVLNRAMINVLGLSEQEAIGKKIKVSFVVTGDLLDESSEKLESTESEYEIVGIVTDEDVPFFYVPFIDLRGLGITNYSQLKVVVADEKDVDTVRKQIEGLGYSTASVKDTIDQIDSLFATARLILASIGLVALSVAALGMFNTMSVSLLERTREVGLMKAMGMRSYEVKELFLTESMIMGFMGGVLGIVLGLIGGVFVSMILSAFAVVKGSGFINISYLPIGFVIFIIILSVVVGLVTGIYPARRATKISALNALRYE